MQELPDPMTSITYASWVEMNPKTAKDMKVMEGDVVQVESAFGKVKSRVHIYPAIMPDVVAMPMGQGHSSFGRYAKDRGSNPIQILAPAKDRKSGAFAWAATRVKITKTKERIQFAKTAGHDRMLGRNIYETTGHKGKKESSGGGH